MEIQEQLSKLSEEIKELHKKFDNRYTYKNKWLNRQETCNYLNISIRTLQSYRDKGILPFSQIGAKIYYKSSDIESILERNYKRV